ncbi:hypothetical protein ACWDOR_23635 [Streptosporangium canum]|uniref:hypothetical protein n=1 Tax=Streptosporangium canum TaxID=324952 RepID=UPI0036C16E61
MTRLERYGAFRRASGSSPSIRNPEAAIAESPGIRNPEAAIAEPLMASTIAERADTGLLPC